MAVFAGNAGDFAATGGAFSSFLQEEIIPLVAKMNSVNFNVVFIFIVIVFAELCLFTLIYADQVWGLYLNSLEMLPKH